MPSARAADLEEQRPPGSRGFAYGGPGTRPSGRGGRPSLHKEEPKEPEVSTALSKIQFVAARNPQRPGPTYSTRPQSEMPQYEAKPDDVYAGHLQDFGLGHNVSRMRHDVSTGRAYSSHEWCRNCGKTTNHDNYIWPHNGEIQKSCNKCEYSHPLPNTPVTELSAGAG